MRETEPAEFDNLSAVYSQIHRENIAITGEEPAYFARYKMRDFARLVAGSGAPRDGHYLDFGSGNGSSVPFFIESMPEARLTCSDVSQQSLARAQAVHGGVARYVPIRNGRLDMPAASLDGAFACCVFHHIPPDQHAKALSELRRVLKPRGLLMIYEHNPLNPLTVRAVNACPLDVNAILIGANEMARRVRAAGFGALRTEHRVFFPAALSMLRPLEGSLRWLPMGAQYLVQAQA